jgi:mannose/cellobiose epimerase-like protein (N-acyl-D-glucosamine 2-epimerase family)
MNERENPGFDAPAYLAKTERYLRERLLPFWRLRLVDREHGGFHTDYDREGRPADLSEKTLLCQARVMATLSLAARRGFGWEGLQEMLAGGIEFLRRHFRDPEQGGYYWMVRREGGVLDDSKVVYGHAFLVYGFAEHALLTGSRESREEACGLCDLLLQKAADLRYGGFLEHFDRAFRPVGVRPGGASGGGELHKSLDVHMHLMEAFSSLYELTGDARHRALLEQLIGLIADRMVDRGSGAGIAMFRPDWTPIPNQQLATVWGSDRFQPRGKPPEITSYGHNVELAWLLLHALQVLGERPPAYLELARRSFRHTLEHGVDREHGGLYVEGERGGGVTDTDKEFWQQAEALVGFLDAHLLTGEGAYLEAFRNVHDFVFQKMINWAQGEWFALLSREGKVLRDYMGSHWKICYHTIRSMVLVVEKLRAIAAGGGRADRAPGAGG